MKRAFLSLLIFAFVAVLGAGDALAKPKGGKPKRPDAPPRTSPTFSALDKDMDGKLTLDEYKAGFPDAKDVEAEFKSLDKDGNGSLSISEYKAGHPDPAVPPKNKNKKKKN